MITPFSIDFFILHLKFDFLIFDEDDAKLLFCLEVVFKELVCRFKTSEKIDYALIFDKRAVGLVI